MRMSGTWSGTWSGFVNASESTSLGLPSARFVVDYNPPLSPNLSAAELRAASTVDSQGQLDGVVNADTFDFGLMRVGTRQDRSVTLRNVGPEESTLVGTIGGILDDPLGNFSVVGGNDFAPLAGGESEAKQVSYEPSMVGEELTYLAITTGRDDFYLPLQGIGTGPMLKVNEGESSISLGEVQIGATSELLVELSNDLSSVLDRTGESLELTGLTVSKIEVLGEGFFVDPLTSTILHDSDGFDLTHSVKLSYSPLAPGKAFGTLRIYTDQDAALGDAGTVFEFELTATTVPEPLSVSLLAIGTALLAPSRKRHTAESERF